MNAPKQFFDNRVNPTSFHAFFLNKNSPSSPCSTITDQGSLIPKLGACHSFLFASWVAPHIFFFKKKFLYNKMTRKQVLGSKKAYTMLTWLYYMTSFKSQHAKTKKIWFAILPRRTTKYTLTKAPMAHKTFSQEQFQFQYYRCRISFKSTLCHEPVNNTLSETQLCMLTIKELFPFFETNLLFLKKASVSLNLPAFRFYSTHLFRL